MISYRMKPRGGVREKKKYSAQKANEGWDSEKRGGTPLAGGLQESLRFWESCGGAGSVTGKKKKDKGSTNFQCYRGGRDRHIRGRGGVEKVRSRNINTTSQNQEK